MNKTTKIIIISAVAYYAIGIAVYYWKGTGTFLTWPKTLLNS